ncbi:hypothetical protein [Notoacmeibacter marinus]|uniref:hypothetical protein n=1 Tax=Notoacmeibacter marinus TaxID=1876515 RepID=UPI000DF2D751|nr:hypothetical protein [Notoacmeibacter marinus]
MTDRNDNDHRAKFDLPRETIVPLERIELRQIEGSHPYELRHRVGIEAEWKRRKAATPSLFDGRFCLMERLALSADGVLRGAFHIGRYATFLHWLARREEGIEHLFAHAVPVLSDGTLLAVRMGEATLNAGRVYFAAGSFDADDVHDGAIDVQGNMLREVAEETGIDLKRGKREPALWFWGGTDGASCLFQRFAMPFSSNEMEAFVQDHIATQTQPELASAVVLRSLDDLPTNAPAHMAPFIRFHFEQAAGLGDEKDGERP